jgi:hypothetical protein
MIRYTSRATYRFRPRRISLLLLPSAVRLAMYSRVRSSQLIRQSARARAAPDWRLCCLHKVEAMVHCLARGGRHRSHATQKGEGRLALLAPLWVVPDGD